MNMNERKKRREILRKRIIIGLVFMNLFLLGSVCNLLAISQNGGKMPVYTNTPFETSDRHFIFNDSSQVNEFIFTDIMRVSFVQQGFEVYFSIGDVIIYLTGIVFFIYCSVVLIMDIKYIFLKMRNKSNHFFK